MSLELRPTSLALGPPPVSLPQSLNRWDKSLQAIIRRLPNVFHTFSRKVLSAHTNPQYNDIYQALVPIQQVVIRLRDLKAVISQQWFPLNGQTGQILLLAMVDRIWIRLRDLFTFFINTMEKIEHKNYDNGGLAIVWEEEIECRRESKIYHQWYSIHWQTAKRSKRHFYLPSFLINQLPNLTISLFHF